MSDTTVNDPAGAAPAEPVPTPVPPAPADAPVLPGAPLPPAPPPNATDPVTRDASRRPRPAVRAAAAVLAAVLAGVCIGVGILHVRYGDESSSAAPAPSAGAPSAAPSPAFGAKSNGTHFGPFRDLLLPVPDGYRPGPDAGAYGNDTELTDAQRKSWVEDEVRGLPPKLRDAVRKSWQEIPLRGGGVRTMVSTDDDLQATFWLLQYHQDAVKATEAWTQALGSDTELYRLGPQVPGHPEAHCFLPYAPPGSQIDSLDCSAAVGDLRATLHVEGVAPLSKDGLVTLFAKQLDRLALPGASA